GFAYATDLSEEHGAPPGLLVSGPDPEEFVAALAEHLERSPAPRLGPSELQVPPRRRDSVAPVPIVERAPIATFGALRTANADFAHRLEQLKAVAPSNVSIILLGESGTGKEF